MRSVSLTCRNRHTFTTSAKAGGTTHCPACRREGRGRVAVRVPTHAYDAGPHAAPAADGGEAARLAALWADQASALPGRFDREGDTGRACPDCGGPLYWAGAHTVQLCPARHADGKAHLFASPGAVEREREHAARRAQLAQRADGDREPASAGKLGDAEAIELERRKGALIGQLDALDGDHLAPDVRRVLAWFRRQVDAAEGEARLDALVELFAEAGIRERGWRRRRLVLDADDQAEDGDYPEPGGEGGQADGAGRGSGQLAELARQLGVMPGQAPGRVAAPLCEPCHGSGRQRLAVKRIDPFGHGGQQGKDVCAGHLAEYGPGMQVIAEYGACGLGAVAAARARAAPVPGYTPPDPNWRAKATPAEHAYWDAITGTGTHPAIARAIEARR
jgi:hypothetical protein